MKQAQSRAVRGHRGPGGRWCRVGKDFMDSNIGNIPVEGKVVAGARTRAWKEKWGIMPTKKAGLATDC